MLSGMSDPLTEQQNRNVENILRLAKGYSAKSKAEAVKRCDFDTSIRIASNEAKVESYFRERGVEVRS